MNLCYKKLDGLKIGDVFEYMGERGILRHYVISFLFKSMGCNIAVVLFPDGYSEQCPITTVKKDKYIKNIDWQTIHDEFLGEANMYN